MTLKVGLSEEAIKLDLRFRLLSDKGMRPNKKTPTLSKNKFILKCSVFTRIRFQRDAEIIID